MEERAQSQQLRHQWIIGWECLHVWEGSWGDSPPCGPWQAGQGSSLCLGSRGKGILPVVGELTSSWLIGSQGNQQRGMALTTPLIRWLTSWAWGKYVGRSVICIGCRWSRHWSGREWTETEGNHFECPDCTYVFTKGEPFVLEDRLAVSRCGVPLGKNLKRQAPGMTSSSLEHYYI